MALLAAAKHFFKSRPLVANCCIYGSLYVGAELSQQTITKKFLSEKPQNIDVPTLGRYAVMGTAVYSPILFYWYKWLDRAFPGTTKKIIFRKLLLDQFVLSPPLLVIFFTGMALMEMQKRPFDELQAKFVPTFQRSCLFWLPTQTVNFYLVPPQFRIIFMGFASFMWCNILCYVKRQKLSYEKSN